MPLTARPWWRQTHVVGLLVALLMAPCGCRPPDAVPVLADDPLVVPVWWVAGGDDLTWDQARDAVWWALSNLGATPPEDEGGIRDVDAAEDGVRFTLDLSAAGFPEASLPAVEAALVPVRDAARTEGAVDLGRFLLATLYDPGRYYAITGACPTFEAWRGARQVPEPGLYAVTVSLLVTDERLVALNPVLVSGASDDPTLDTLGWVASEGEGSLVDGTFTPREFETVDVMPNGQQRFAVYDGDGVLRAASATGPAGQPGKCMWCHELGVQEGTAENPSAEGYYTYDAFVAEVAAAEALLASARSNMPSAINWEYATHEWAEQLTMAFLEPSPARVAHEWGVPVESVTALGLPTHIVPEFPDWGPVYDRADVDAIAPDGPPTLATPPSDRDLHPAWPLVGVDGLDCAADAGGR
ncbi:MAG: hypothetical protein V4850_00685 [Myxococcota bacterium]